MQQESDPRLVMIYDGDCTFCRWWIIRLESRIGNRVEFLPLQTAGERFPNLAREKLEQAVHLVETNGNVTRGAHAVFRSLHVGGSTGFWLWLYQYIPGCAALFEFCYRFVARHRRVFSFLTKLMWGSDPRPSTYGIARNVFVRGLGLVFFIAHVSLWLQIDGLIGSRGILPVVEYLTHVENQLGDRAFFELPTLVWFNSSDVFLHILCGAGTVLSFLLFVGLVPFFIIPLLWAIYLSLKLAGQDFFNFQWDTLLLESSLVAMFLAPMVWRMRFRFEDSPSFACMLPVRFLLFKLMFLSGATKLLSGDPTWRDGTAMTFHYETQPIPAWTSWYIHQMPEWFHRVSAFSSIALEMSMCVLIFFPRRIRHVAAVLLIGLQFMIGVTGNYGFFNLLSILLCLILFDDQLIRLVFGRRKSGVHIPEREKTRSTRFTSYPRGILIGLYVVLSLFTIDREVARTLNPGSLPRWTVSAIRSVSSFLISLGRGTVLQYIEPYRTINGYGLFRVMTTERPEIVIEGSSDGVTWKPYEFNWKAGDPMRRPRFVQPHQPRLDWQMWFAALSPRGYGRMLTGLSDRLLENEPSVVALLRENPFPDNPPEFIRLSFYDYEFTDFEERRRTGMWWKRQLQNQTVPFQRSE